jgi:CMP/dCMP kinase
MIITIDGPAGTGKTTIARMLAERLKFAYFDTGAMYRALTYYLSKQQVELKDEEKLSTLLKNFQFEIREMGKEKRYFVFEKDVTELIRTEEITRKVSEIAALPAVREALVAIQREYGKKKNAIFEGRDMGTIVFPKADVKIFLTARASVRAERRYFEFKEKNHPVKEQQVLKDILERDQFDASRLVSPLKQAEDAHLIDTSDLTVDQVIEKMLTFIPKK